MIRGTFRFCLGFLIGAIFWVIIFPEDELPSYPDIVPTERPNYWLQHQTGTRFTIQSRKPLDDPSEAWHEADYYDDSDDSELYNDIYDGK